jgi:hypothetical protein
MAERARYWQEKPYLYRVIPYFPCTIDGVKYCWAEPEKIHTVPHIEMARPLQRKKDRWQDFEIVETQVEPLPGN